MEENEHVLIRFQDTGVGMSKKVKQKMFDAFFTTRKVGEGTGLGLFHLIWHCQKNIKAGLMWYLKKAKGY